MYDQENIIGLIGVSIDITNLRKTQSNEVMALNETGKALHAAKIEKESKDAVTVLAGSIAHDLKLPLTSIILTTDLFQLSTNRLFESVTKGNELIDEKVLFQTHLEQVALFSTKMKSIAREMHAFINVTLKSMQRLVTNSLSDEDFTVCEIEAHINEVLSKFPFEKQEKDLIHISEIHNFSFLGSSVLFYRVLFNLINNALDQIREKSRGEIFISTKENEAFNTLLIRDTASGASPEVIAHLFDGYYTTKEQGTGVGLAFCKLTMNSFGGNIGCHSKEGDYIEFVLSFPKLN